MKSDPPPDLAELVAARTREIRRAVNVAFAVIGVLIAATVAATAIFYSQTADLAHRANEQARQGAQARAAICALREDIVQRLATSKAFLAEHPQGIPGIPAATLQTSIDNENRTIAALSGVDCG